ncbi:MAG: hypothetical protein ACLTV6_08125 [Christensenellales bacterium]
MTQERTKKKSAAAKVQLGSTSGEVKFKELALIPTFLHERFIDFEIRRQLFSPDMMRISRASGKSAFRTA